MITGDLVGRMEQLLADRVPFVTATVVRAARPTSVHPGDSALVLADGTIEGFVGGVCAQASVRLHAVRALETGEPVLLRLLPGTPPGAGDAGPDDGIVVAHNPCLSGGSLEIFLEPQIATARVVVVGDTPIARAVAELALEAGVGYVGLVASATRGAAVRDSLAVPDALRAGVHTPAGLDIGARAPADVAISILAELVAERTAHPPVAVPEPVLAAVDPVCGMQVAATDATLHLDAPGGRVYFCCESCRSTYAEQAGDVASR
jgi:xanthine dehydrogenase accessory factor